MIENYVYIRTWMSILLILKLAEQEYAYYKTKVLITEAMYVIEDRKLGFFYAKMILFLKT